MKARRDRRQFFKDSLSGTAGLALGLTAGSAVSLTAADAPKASAIIPGSADSLPLGKIGPLKVSRLLLGGNLLTHYAHSRDLRYVYSLTRHYNTREKIFETMALAETHGVNTLVIHTADGVVEMLKQYRKEHGGKMQWIICPTAPIEPGLKEFKEQVRQMLADGVDAIYIWGVRSDALVEAGKVDLLGEAVDAVKSMKAVCGVGGHHLEVIDACEQHKVPADFYIKTLHHANYPTAKLNYDSSWCPDATAVIRRMETVEKPWIAFKTMAAGAIPPKSAFSYAVEAGADFILAGMFDFEIAEDVQIMKAALAEPSRRQRPWLA